MAARRTAGDSRRRRTRLKAPLQGFAPIPPPRRSRVGREEQTSRMGRRKGQAIEQSNTNAVDGTRSGKSSLGVTDFEEGEEQTRPLGYAEKGVDRSPSPRPHKTPLEHTSENMVLALLSHNDLQDAPKQPTMEGKKQAKLTRRAALVEGVIRFSSNKELVKYFKNGATRTLKEIHCLRSKLDRAEAAVEGGRLAQKSAVTELQEKLDECRQMVHQMEKEAQQHRIQHTKSKVEEVRLQEELKEAQEALSFLSEWDEEKIELESEVARLTKKVSAAVEEGKGHLEEARRAFLNTSAEEVYKMQKQIIKDREVIRQELERELSEEFRNRRRENEELRREREHYNQEMNWILKELMKAKAARYVRRTELEDERRMHLMTIRKQKKCEAMIAKLKTRLTDAMSSKLSQPEHPRTSAYPGVLSAVAPPNVPHIMIQRSPQPAHDTGRGISGDGSHRAGSSGGTEMSDELAFGQCRGTSSRIGSSNNIYGNSNRSNGQEASVDRSKVTEPLMPAWSEGTNTFDKGTASTVEHDSGNVSTDGGRKRRRSCADVVEGDVICRGNDCNGFSFKIGTCGHMSKENSSSETATPGGKSGRGNEEESEVPEVLPRIASEVTSTDVWSQLDSYVNRRRSEVARAKRHVRVIDAMCKNLPKSTCHIGNTTKISHRRNTTIRHAGKLVQVQGRADRSKKKYDVAWGASQRRQTWRRANSNDSTLVNKFSFPVKERSIVSDSEETFSGSVLPSDTSSKPRTNLKPHPPRRVRRALQLDGSVSSLSQGTTSGTLGTLDEKEQEPDRTVVTLGMTPVHTVDPNYIQVEDAERYTPTVMTRLPDYTAKGTDCSGGDRASLGKVLHIPHSRWYHGADSTNSLCSNDSLNAGPDIGGSRPLRLLLGSKIRMTTNCVTRAPGAVGTLNDGGNAWVNINSTIERTPPQRKKREDGDIHDNPRPAGRVWRIGGGIRGGKLGAKRRNYRKLELADWIQANTSLVNVSPL